MGVACKKLWNNDLVNNKNLHLHGLHLHFKNLKI
jgi:hypothetical protein